VENQKLTDSLSSLQKDLTDYQKQNRELRDELQSAEEKNEGLGKEVGKWQQLVKELEEKVGDLEAKNLQYKQSLES